MESAASSVEVLGPAEVFAASSAEGMAITTKFITIPSEFFTVSTKLVAVDAILFAIAVNSPVESIVAVDAVSVAVIPIAIAIPRTSPVAPPVATPPSAAGAGVIPTRSAPRPAEGPVEESADSAEVDVHIRSGSASTAVRLPASCSFSVPTVEWIFMVAAAVDAS